MKPFTLLLLVALVISVSINLLLLTNTQTNLISPPSVNPVNEPALSQKTALLPPKVPPPNHTRLQSSNENKQRITQVKTFIRNKQFSEAQEAIQSYLKRYPRDIETLFLEASLLNQSGYIHDALIQLYDLLDFPLNDQQRSKIEAAILSISETQIATLRDIKSWDLLATFLEPLWQLAPNNRSYVVNLAEAYAWQNLQAPMENILASMMPGDNEAIRIRSLLDSLHDSLPPTSPNAGIPAESDVQRTPLSRSGDHFIVETAVENQIVKLLIDTGASTTVLSESTFENLLSESNRKLVGYYNVNTAGGTVNAPLYRVSKVSINNYSVKNMAIIVLPLNDFAQADGLLGMNFLREFNFQIDQQSDLLLLRSH